MKQTIRHTLSHSDRTIAAFNHPLGNRIMHIFYRQEMNASTLSSSPSAHKPREVMLSWLSRFDGLEIIPPKPVSAAQLSLAHDADYVADILACRAKNGFWNRDPAIAKPCPTPPEPCWTPRAAPCKTAA